MILAHAREIASTYAEGPIADAVITVPSTWGQIERKTMAAAAELAGIKLHQLMNTNAAVALHYGVFNRKAIDSKPKVEKKLRKTVRKKFRKQTLENKF